MSGSRLLPGSMPAAHCYAGHQFGHFSGQLGDGAATYLGEVSVGDGAAAYLGEFSVGDGAATYLGELSRFSQWGVIQPPRNATETFDDALRRSSIKGGSGGSCSSKGLGGPPSAVQAMVGRSYGAVYASTSAARPCTTLAYPRPALPAWSPATHGSSGIPCTTHTLSR